jgi:hypothetical protein
MTAVPAPAATRCVHPEHRVVSRVFEVRIKGALSDNERDAFRQISDFTITEAPLETIIRGRDR